VGSTRKRRVVGFFLAIGLPALLLIPLVASSQTANDVNTSRMTADEARELRRIGAAVLMPTRRPLSENLELAALRGALRQLAAEISAARSSLPTQLDTLGASRAEAQRALSAFQARARREGGVLVAQDLGSSFAPLWAELDQALAPGTFDKAHLDEAAHLVEQALADPRRVHGSTYSVRSFGAER